MCKFCHSNDKLTLVANNVENYEVCGNCYDKQLAKYSRTCLSCRGDAYSYRFTFTENCYLQCEECYNDKKTSVSDAVCLEKNHIDNDKYCMSIRDVFRNICTTHKNCLNKKMCKFCDTHWDELYHVKNYHQDYEICGNCYDKQLGKYSYTCISCKNCVVYYDFTFTENCYLQCEECYNDKKTSVNDSICLEKFLNWDEYCMARNNVTNNICDFHIKTLTVE